MNFNRTGTTIGSLPYTNPQDALELIFKFTPSIPAWPQLPKRTFKENMYVQYSENLPGIVIDEQTEKIFVNTETALVELEKFYEHYLANDFDYFAISKEYAAGFYSLLNYLISQSPNFPITAIKCQTTGPVTFGLAVKTETGQSIFYDSQLRDVVLKHIAMKSIWQIKQFLTLNSQLTTHNSQLSTLILFLDEPYLAAYGSAFTAISREEIIDALQEVISVIKSSADLLAYSLTRSLAISVGVHCCANTDWSILLDTDIDILSFDAYEFFDNLILYRDKLKEFIDSGKTLAWGIIPTNEETLKSETVQSLHQRLNASIDKLIDTGIDKEKLSNQMLISPACGLGSRSHSTAELALKLLFELSRTPPSYPTLLKGK